ncbi:hypothetical protein GQ43DRAFT_463955 [Delitschia confertaspora ATCC 74209]|uniref:KOW domain-containing protein n=1 Tax=Delitschia confertaspora ATCC 74209 TaxID=1513339 RepID=A0A9P4JJ99_9PLEO|nr:hypothetical protein GQ43DRAFT_463955 [Delitschia confertaspora ATCC 74209]
MQNVIRRTQRTVRRAERAANRDTINKQKQEKRQFLRAQQQQQSATLQDIKNARKARIEDWNLGPLAPNRAIGRDAAKYGALDRIQSNPLEVPSFMRRKVWPIVEGDRVVITKGLDAGKIGTVKILFKEREAVAIEDLRMAYVDGAMFEGIPGQKNEARREIEIPVPYNQIQLVVKWKDPRTEQTKDVVVEKVEMRPRGHERDPDTNERIYDRFIPGTGIEIPFPDKERPELKDTDSDTLRITVEENSFIPTLLIPPMPETVIDELRNPYSKFRHRHEEEYVEKMSAVDAKENNKEDLLVKMRTPLQEHHARLQEAKKAQPPKVLTEEVLARIGMAMAANRAGNTRKTTVKVDRDA